MPRKKLAPDYDSKENEQNQCGVDLAVVHSTAENEQRPKPKRRSPSKKAKLLEKAEGEINANIESIEPKGACSQVYLDEIASMAEELRHSKAEIKHLTMENETLKERLQKHAIGRKSVIDTELHTRVRELRAEGVSYRKIATELGVAVGTVYKVMGMEIQ